MIKWEKCPRNQWKTFVIHFNPQKIPLFWTKKVVTFLAHWSAHSCNHPTLWNEFCNLQKNIMVYNIIKWNQWTLLNIDVNIVYPKINRWSQLYHSIHSFWCIIKKITIETTKTIIFKDSKKYLHDIKYIFIFLI